MFVLMEECHRTDRNTQLFFELAAQRVGVRFATLNFAAGKLPLEGKG